METYQSKLEEEILLDIHEVPIPIADIIGPLADRWVVVHVRCYGIVLVILAPFDDLSKNPSINLYYRALVTYLFLDTEAYFGQRYRFSLEIVSIRSINFYEMGHRGCEKRRVFDDLRVCRWLGIPQ